MQVPPSSRGRRWPFYGWWIVAAAFWMYALNSGLFGFTFGAYMLQMQERFGWSKFAMSTAYSASQFATGLAGPAQGWAIDRFGPRAMMTVGSLLFGLAFMALAAVHSLLALYAAVLAITLGGAMAGFLTTTTGVASWFQRRRALALGISSTGLGAGGLLAPLIAWSIVTYGWRPTAFASGIAILALGLPLSQLMRRRPEDYGLLPDGVVGPGPREQRRGPGPALGSIDFTLGEALRDRSFWLTSLGHGTALLTVFAMMVHLVPYLVEEAGWSETSAQGLFGFVTLISVAGQIGGGYLGDRFRKTFISALCMAGHCVAMLLLTFSTATEAILAASLVHGLSWGVRAPLMMAIRADFYGRRYLATIMGYSLVLVMFGSMIGPSFAGAMNDRFGDYQAAFLILGVLTGLGSTFFLLARRPPLPERLKGLAGGAE